MKTPKCGLAIFSLALFSCEKELATGPSLPVSVKPAARVAVPMDLTTLTPWTLGSEQVITYSTDATGANLETVKESFRQWSAIFMNPIGYSTRSFVKFSYIPSTEYADILVLTNASTTTAGCRSDISPRKCTIQLKAVDLPKIRHWIGRTMGVPTTSSGAAIMNPATSPGWVFTSLDLSQVHSVYTSVNGFAVTTPLFEAVRTTVPGYELIVGWDALLARRKSGYVSTYKTIASIIAWGQSGAMANTPPATFQVYKYLTGGTSGNFYPLWPHMNQDWSAYGGLRGSDPSPATIGQGCYASSTTSSNSVGSLYAFDPSRMCIRQSGNSVQLDSYGMFPAAFTTGIWFYVGQGLRASTTDPGSSVCSRLSGYGFALE